jgi:pyruvate dehydrogenase E2 component (dihydrolipoamide acetyltransferase)
MEAAGPKGTVEVIEPTRAERAIARRAAESRATIPDLELSIEIDAEAFLETGLPVLTLLVRACALALRDHPRANSAYRDGRFELYSRVNVGVVLPAHEELVTATVFDADHKPLTELAAEIESLERRIEELAPPERTAATFTVWQAEKVTGAIPIIPAPQAAALCAGEVRDAPMVRDGAVVPGKAMTLALACDYRILHGGYATGFLARIRELLESPAEL